LQLRDRQLPFSTFIYDVSQTKKKFVANFQARIKIISLARFLFSLSKSFCNSESINCCTSLKIFFFLADLNWIKTISPTMLMLSRLRRRMLRLSMWKRPLSWIFLTFLITIVIAPVSCQDEKPTFSRDSKGLSFNFNFIQYDRYVQCVLVFLFLRMLQYLISNTAQLVISKNEKKYGLKIIS